MTATTVISVVGVRPQFIKLAPLSSELRRQGYNEIIIHTGQHFDENMSRIFFDQMGIPEPDINLAINEASHGAQTGRMLVELEAIYQDIKPELVLVFGDTNTTLAAALAASKLHMPLLHVEAGLRSYDKQMPEEQNRIITDHISHYLACPSQHAMDNLKKEGIEKGVYITGDVMYDAVKLFSTRAKELNIREQIADKLNMVLESKFGILTIHRASNTDHPETLCHILQSCALLNYPILFPIHPRTRQKVSDYQLTIPPNIQCIEPVGYMEMLMLIESAAVALTDSGGLQKEVFFVNTPCITFRDTTEWMETVELGWNTLVMDDPMTINHARMDYAIQKLDISLKSHCSYPYGTGEAAQRIVDIINNNIL